jgi:hypothetical protein
MKLERDSELMRPGEILRVFFSPIGLRGRVLNFLIGLSAKGLSREVRFLLLLNWSSESIRGSFGGGDSYLVTLGTSEYLLI